MKKIILVITMVMLLTVCSFSSVLAEEEWSDVNQYRTETPFTIGWSINYTGISWRTEFVEEFEQQAKRLGSVIGETIVLNAGGSISKQIADIEDLMTKDIDALIVCPQSPQAISPIIEEVYNSGIPVIVVNDTIATDKYTSFVSTNDFEFGVVGAKWLAEELDGKGDIAILDGIAGNGVAIARYDGAMSVFEEYPDINIVAHEYGAWSYDKGKMIMQNILTSNPDIDGIWSSGGAMTLGAIDAYNEAGLPLIPMTGEAQNGFIKKWIANQDKGFTSIAPYKPTWLSAAGLNYAVQALLGFPVPKNAIYPTPLYTEDEIHDIVETELPDTYWLGSLLEDEVVKDLFLGQ